MRLPAVLCCCFLLAGCTGQPGGPGAEEVRGPGRFPHSALYKTIAPWDGPATWLILSEEPLKKEKTVSPCVSVSIYRAAADLSGQRVRLGGKESRQGHAAWVARGGAATDLESTDVAFEEVQEGKPVRGRYDVEFADGRRERGRFEAAWWPADGPGG